MRSKGLLVGALSCIVLASVIIGVGVFQSTTHDAVDPATGAHITVSGAPANPTVAYALVAIGVLFAIVGLLFLVIRRSK